MRVYFTSILFIVMDGIKKENKAVLILFGMGGTGGYVAKEFSRYYGAKTDAEKRNQKIAIEEVHGIDGDVVEAKNLARQCFEADDIGLNKAEVLCGALNDTFDMSWVAHDVYVTALSQIDEIMHEHKEKYYTRYIPVIVGCVDNHACRKLLEEFFEKSENCIYIDSANEFDDGEVIFATKIGGKVMSPCRSWYFPNLFEDPEIKPVTEMSCTELNNVAPQHIATNMMAGSIIFSALCNMFETGEIVQGMKMFNARKGTICSYSKEQWKPYTGEIQELGGTA